MRNPYACAAKIIFDLFDEDNFEKLMPELILEQDMEANGGEETAIRLLKAAIHAGFNHAHEADFVEKGFAAVKAEAETIAAELKAKQDAAG